MDVKEFLLTSKSINREGVARLMWPDNDTAGNYLTAKLTGTGQRRFTRKDAQRALDALKQLSDDLSGLTIADTY